MSLRRLKLYEGSSGPELKGAADGEVLTWVEAEDAWESKPGTGGGAVSSVFTRVGAVAAALNDYAASLIDNDSSASGSTVKDALNALLAAIPSVPVSTVFGRVGAIVSALNDYAASQIANDSSVVGSTVKDALNALLGGGLAPLTGTITTTPEFVPAGEVTGGAATFQAVTRLGVALFSSDSSVNDLHCNNGTLGFVRGGLVALPQGGYGNPGASPQFDILDFDNTDGVAVSGLDCNTLTVRNFAKNTTLDGCSVRGSGSDLNSLYADLFNCNLTHALANTGNARMRSCSFLLGGAAAFDLVNCQMDGPTEGEFFKSGGGLTGALVALSSNQGGNAAGMADADTVVDFSGALRLIISATRLSVNRALTIGTGSGLDKQIFTVDSYNATGKTVTVNGALVIGDGNLRYKFQIVSAAIVLLSIESL